MAGCRGYTTIPPRNLNLGEARAANNGGWQPTLAYRDRSIMCGPETQIAAGVVHCLASPAWTLASKQTSEGVLDSKYCGVKRL